MDFNNKTKRKIFKPILVPRYLPGSLGRTQIKQDLKEYNKHRYRCFAAKPSVDCKAPFLSPYNYVSLNKLVSDSNRLMQIQKHNKELVFKINEVNRKKGGTDCWNLTYNRTSRWPQMVQRKQKVIKENKEVYKLISNAASYYDHREHEEAFQKFKKALAFAIKFPMVLFGKKNYDQLMNDLPSIGYGLEQLGNRPQVYMSFKLQNGPLLGQVIIELYSDYAPESVQNFLAFCTSNDPKYSYKNCRIYDSRKNEYFETGDTIKNNGKDGISIFGESFIEELTPLRHIRPGVLSMVRINHMEKSRRINLNNSRFAITFSAMPHLDGKRAVFGQVIRGFKTLCRINDTSKRRGTPLMNVIISRCGEIPSIDLKTCDGEGATVLQATKVRKNKH